MKHEFIYIVTGTTRGIGRAIALGVNAREHRLYTIARGPEDKSHRRWDLSCDLCYPEQIAAIMSHIIDDATHRPADDIVLVNNAGMLGPVFPFDAISVQQMHTHMQVNLLAPAQLMALFIDGTSGFKGKRRIINISSGAAQHPYAGWALYCAAKAALEMMTRCVSLEQERRFNGVAISAVAPGIVATDMQIQIRSTNDDHFPERHRFVRMHEAGQLQSPETVANLLLDLDASGQFDNGGLYDLRDVVWHNGYPSIATR